MDAWSGFPCASLINLADQISRPMKIADLAINDSIEAEAFVSAVS